MALAGVGINTVSGFTASIKYALNSSVENAAKEAQRLSTGMKIINAYEDAAGLVIGIGLEGESRTLKVVLRGILQGQSALYIAEGAVNSLTQITVRQKELVAAALSGVTSDKERGFIQLEFSQLNEEINRIATTTNFNGVHLIDGSISTGGNVVTNTKNITGGTGVSTLNYTVNIAPPTAGANTMDINGVSFRYGTAVAADAAINVRKANDVIVGFKDINAAATAVLKLTMGTGAVPFAAGKVVTVDIAAPGTVPAAPVAGKITVAAGTGAQIAQRIADQINANSAVLDFGTMSNVTAKAEGNSLIIQSGKVFMDAATMLSASYTVETSATPATQITSIQVGSNPATIIDATSTAATAKTTVSDYADGKAIALKTANISEVVTKIANQINGGTALVLDTYNQSILSRLSATATPGTTVTSPGTISISSKDKGLNGRILMNHRTAAVAATGGNPAIPAQNASSVGVYSSGTKVGSLGVSNVSVGGSLLGTGASYIRNMQFKTSSTGSTTLTSQPTTVGTVTTPATTQTIVNDGAIFRIGSGIGSSIDFVFRQNPVFPNDVQIIGNAANNNSDWKATLVNLVDKLRESSDPIVQNLSYELNAAGNLTISSKVADSSVNNMAFSFLPSATGAATQTLTMNGGSASGLNMSNISGTSFAGSIDRSNVSAIFESTNKITLNITSPDGSVTYSAKGIDVSAGGKARFVSNKEDQGGSFDIDFAGNQSVSNQDGAALFAATLGDALAGVKFYQTRRIETFTPPASASVLNGAFAEISSNSYKGTVNVRSVDVVGTTSDAMSSNKSFVTIKTDDGRTFQNIFNPGETLQYIAKGQKLTLVSVDAKGVPLDKNEKIDLYFGNADVDMTDNTAITGLKLALNSAFNAGQSPMKFQADSNVNVVIPIALDALDIKTLYDGMLYSVATADGAAEAGSAVDQAINKLLAARDNIGSYESRFNYVIQSLQSYVQNMDAARSAFLDTSMPDSVEGFSKENMKTQTAISVLKQIIQTQQQLVSLVQ